jgi:alpha-1,6-mannosyltransferase
VISQEAHDPVYRFSTWHGLHSPYGPLFTAATYLLPFGSLAASYWVMKVATVAASLAFLGLVWVCARRLGRDPRFALLFVGANPIYLIFAVGGFHNDFFMLIPSTAAIALLLSHRYRWAGAVLMLAVAVKFSAVLLLPFLLAAAPDHRRRLDLVLGSVLVGGALAAMSIAVFGFTLPNLQDQSTLLTDFSIPNLFGLLIGIGGGTPGLLRVAKVALVMAIALLVAGCLRAGGRRADWISRAGWGTLALLASLAWLMPWYVIWAAPLAALGSSPRLRRATLAMTLFLVLTFVPLTGIILARHRLDPLSGPPGQASRALQQKLAQ